jgi:hypothetical protein
VHCEGSNTPALDQRGRDAFRIDHRFISGHVEMEGALVDPPEGTQGGAERRAGPFAGVAVDLAVAIPIIIPGPRVHAMAHGGMGRMAATRALPCVRGHDRAGAWDMLGNQVVAGTRVRVIADPATLFARLSRDHADHRGTSVRRGAVPSPLMGPPPGWVIGIEMGRAFFPPRSDRVRRPPRRRQA